MLWSAAYGVNTTSSRAVTGRTCDASACRFPAEHDAAHVHQHNILSDVVRQQRPRWSLDAWAIRLSRSATPEDEANPFVLHSVDLDLGGQYPLQRADFEPEAALLGEHNFDAAALSGKTVRSHLTSATCEGVSVAESGGSGAGPVRVVRRA